MQKAKKLFMLMAMLFCGMAAAWAAQTVTVIQPQNGQVTFSPATPAAGEMVTITVTPDQGYCIHKAEHSRKHRNQWYRTHRPNTRSELHICNAR